VFDVVNATTIQGLGIRPIDSFASLLSSILTLLLLSSGCPVVSCAVVQCPAVLDRPPFSTETVLGVMQHTKLIDMQHDMVMNNIFEAF